MKRHEKDCSRTASVAAAGGDDAAPVENVSRSKRTLLKAGWVAPMIAVVSLPASGYAVNSSGECNDPYRC